MSEREMERILAEEQDERVVEEAISEFIGVPGGRYWEPGSEDISKTLPEEQWIPDDVELPFN